MVTMFSLSRNCQTVFQSDCTILPSHQQCKTRFSTISLHLCQYLLLLVNGNPLQYSCLETPMDGGAWWAAVHGVEKSRTRLSDFTFTFPISLVPHWVGCGITFQNQTSLRATQMSSLTPHWGQKGLALSEPGPGQDWGIKWIAGSGVSQGVGIIKPRRFGPPGCSWAEDRTHPPSHVSLCPLRVLPWSLQRSRQERDELRA